MKLKKRITLTVDEEIFEKFKQYCKENGMKVSTRLEVLMEKELEKEVI